MSTSRNKKIVYAIFADIFMTPKFFDSIGMHSTQIFYNHFHLKLNLEKLLICKWKILYPIINSMFIAKNKEMLNSLSEKFKNLCGHLNNDVSIW